MEVIKRCRCCEGDLENVTMEDLKIHMDHHSKEAIDFFNNPSSENMTTSKGAEVTALILKNLKILN